MSHTVGSVSCLVVLCTDTARRESRCPLYHVPLFVHKVTTNLYWLIYKILPTWLLTFTDLLSNFDWPYLQTFTDLITKLLLTSTITNYYWPHYKKLLTSLQNFTDLITNFCWPHYKILLTSLQNFTEVITNLVDPLLHYKTLLTSLQNFTDLITNFY